MCLSCPAAWCAQRAAVHKCHPVAQDLGTGAWASTRGGFLPERPSWGLGLSTGPGMALLGTSEQDGGEREPRDWPRFGAEGKELAEAVLGCWNREDAGFLRWKWDKAAATTWG